MPPTASWIKATSPVPAVAAAADVGVTAGTVGVGGRGVGDGGTAVAVGFSPPQAYSPTTASAISTKVSTIALVCFTTFLLCLIHTTNVLHLYPDLKRSMGIIPYKGT